MKEEEYIRLLERNKLLRNLMFEEKVDAFYTKDETKYNELKKEYKHNLVLITHYEIDNNIDKGEKKDEKHKGR